LENNVLLKVKNLKKYFPVRGGILSKIIGYVQAVDEISFDIKGGETLGLVGESGCGKTTTMKTILRLLASPPAKVTGGQVLFKGQDLLAYKAQRMEGTADKGISMIFQDPTAALNPVFTVGKQLSDTARYAGPHGRTASRRHAREAAIDVLRKVSMPDPDRIMKNYPVQLSGGMKQRVCIALALLGATDLLVADEPTTSLDVTIQEQILRLLESLVEEFNTAIILISHAVGMVKGITEEINVMYAGTIVEHAPTPQFFSSPLHPYSQALLAAVPRLTGEGIPEGIAGRMVDYLSPPLGCRFYPRCPHRMEQCKEQKPPFFEKREHQVACFLYEEDW